MIEEIQWVKDDGGRAAAGYKGSAGDCGVRAISIATGMGYQAAYDLVKRFCATEKPSKSRRGSSSPRTGIHGVTMRKIMASLGWTWVPTMGIGTGCRVHLTASELPKGKLVVCVSRHYVAVIDSVLHDTYNSGRLRSTESFWDADGNHTPQRVYARCVYGYYTKK